MAAAVKNCSAVNDSVYNFLHHRADRIFFFLKKKLCSNLTGSLSYVLLLVLMVKTLTVLVVRGGRFTTAPGGRLAAPGLVGLAVASPGLVGLAVASPGLVGLAVGKPLVW
jgi:hypothetical protein